MIGLAMLFVVALGVAVVMAWVQSIDDIRNEPEIRQIFSKLQEKE